MGRTERRKGGEQGQAARERVGERPTASATRRSGPNPSPPPGPPPSGGADLPQGPGYRPPGAGWEEEDGKEEGGECACVLLLNRDRLHPPPRLPATLGTC